MSHRAVELLRAEPPRLTPRMVQVAAYLIGGRSTAQIAEALGCSTAAVHIAKSRGSTGSRNTEGRANIVVEAIRIGSFPLRHELLRADRLDAAGQRAEASEIRARHQALIAVLELIKIRVAHEALKFNDLQDRELWAVQAFIKEFVSYDKSEELTPVSACHTQPTETKPFAGGALHPEDRADRPRTGRHAGPRRDLRRPSDVPVQAAECSDAGLADLRRGQGQAGGVLGAAATGVVRRSAPAPRPAPVSLRPGRARLDDGPEFDS